MRSRTEWNRFLRSDAIEPYPGRTQCAWVDTDARWRKALNKSPAMRLKRKCIALLRTMRAMRRAA